MSKVIWKPSDFDRALEVAMDEWKELAKLEILDICKKLTTEEKREIATVDLPRGAGTSALPIRLVRAIILVSAQDIADQCFLSESLRPKVERLRRILKTRPG